MQKQGRKKINKGKTNDQNKSYYFSHDYNARNDRKIAPLVMEYKSSGYGIFWVTCEMMYEEGGELELDDITFSAIAKDLHEDISVVKSVIEKCISYKLFLTDGKKLFSDRVTANLKKRQDISQKRKTAAMQMHANVKQMHINKRKEKENKSVCVDTPSSPSGGEIQPLSRNGEHDPFSEEEYSPAPGWEKFIAEYPVKQDIDQAMGIWNSNVLSNNQKWKAFEQIKPYKKYCEDKSKSPKSPLWYLKDKTFNDDLKPVRTGLDKNNPNTWI